jgi:hypothetical protein
LQSLIRCRPDGGDSDGDEDDDKQAKRGEWRQEPHKDGATGGELDQRYPPLIEATAGTPSALSSSTTERWRPALKQLVISRQHKECPNRDPVQGDREIGPPDAKEQHIHHGAVLRAVTASPPCAASPDQRWR